MKENTVVAFRNPSDFQEDPLTEVLQAGARKLLAQAVGAEVALFLDAHAGNARRRIENRPIAKFLHRVARLATLNHPPVSDETWERNQRSKFLSKKTRRHQH